MDLPLSERIRRLESKMGLDDKENEITLEEQTIKKKSFKIPFKGKISKHKAKNNWVTVVKILENRNVTFEKQQIKNETIIVDELPRVVTPDETLHYKGKPLIILPSWSVKPFSPTDNLGYTEAKQYSAKGHKLLLARMLGEVISAKKKVSLAIVFIILVALIAGGYFLTKTGAFG